MPIFTVQEGYEKRGKIKIEEGSLFIGRDPECGFVIDAGDVSRQHTKVVMKDGVVTVEDMKSRNGTFVNSTPIDKPTVLKHMDVIQIGSNVLVFSDTDVAPVEKGPQKDGQKASDTSGEHFNFAFLQQIIKKIEGNVELVFKGKPTVIRNLLLCLFADGHILIEDAPGVGKSILAQALAKSIQGKYKRIQFTPDMLPSDITGISMYDEQNREFTFIPGPIFGNVILADEINRTTPRTQSSLLECMTESVITIDGKPHVLPKPFFVIATQNPSDYHGTYPLPEPQLDRFQMRVSIGYPDLAAEKEILQSQMERHPLADISYVVTAMDIVQCQALVRQIHISDAIKEYIVRIADATRSHPALSNGCSPRASLALMRMAQSLAAYNGREYVIPRDVRELSEPVLCHRMSLRLRAQGEWEKPANVLKSIIEKTPIEEEEQK